MRYTKVIPLVVLVLGLAACGQRYTAERDGKDAGEAVCDVRTADTPEERASALQDLEAQLDDLAANYAIFTSEDRADITENLSDLAEHADGDNDALAGQDIAVIQRSIDNIRDDVDDTTEAAADGFLEGLDDCTGS